jgi:hypothetical protein
MNRGGFGALAEVLAAKKDAIVREWLARTLRTYPEHTAAFLGRETDRFRNPVGHTVREALPALFDEILGGMDPLKVASLLDRIVRIRAVQDFTAAQAVSFVLLLKQVVRDELRGAGQGGLAGRDLGVLEDRIDEVMLLAFDLFMGCRERLYRIRANEAQRRAFLLDRMDGTRAPLGRPLPGEGDGGRPRP